MQFTSEPHKNHEFKLEVGDFFQESNATFVVVQPLVKESSCDYRNQGFTYVNLTHHSLVYPIFDSLEELQNDLLEEKRSIKFFRGKDVVVNLGKPVYEVSPKWWSN